LNTMANTGTVIASTAVLAESLWEMIPWLTWLENLAANLVSWPKRVKDIQNRLVLIVHESCLHLTKCHQLPLPSADMTLFLPCPLTHLPRLRLLCDLA
jgi:hypothetical protein